jgi:hypothetical protein
MMMSIEEITLGLLLASTSLMSHAAQSGQHRYQDYGVNFRLDNGYFAYLDEKSCALDEKTSRASVYSSGLYQVIVYKAGKYH